MGEEDLRLLIGHVPTALPDSSIELINQRGLDCRGLGLNDVQGWGWTAQFILMTLAAV